MYVQAQSDASAPRLLAPTAPLSTWAIYSGLRSMLSSPSKVSGISSSAYSPHPSTLNSGPVRSSKDQVAMRGEVEELALVVGLHRVEEADDIGLSRDLLVDLPVEGGLLGLVTGLDAAARQDPVLGDAGPGTANDQHRAVGSDEGGADSFDHLSSSLCLLTDSVEQLAAVDGDGLPRDERGGGAHNDATRGRNVLGPRRGTPWRLIRASGRVQCRAGRAFSASTWMGPGTTVLTQVPYGPSSRARKSESGSANRPSQRYTRRGRPLAGGPLHRRHRP